MDADDLTREQARFLWERTGRMRPFIDRLVERMFRRGFPKNDRLYRNAVQVSDGLHSLWVHLHYLSCTGELQGRRRRGDADPSENPASTG